MPIDTRTKIDSPWGLMSGASSMSPLNRVRDVLGLAPVFEFNPERDGAIPTGLPGYSFTRASSATTVLQTSPGVYQLSTVGSNVPRYCEHPATAGVGAYWAEPAVTNEALHSADASNAAWGITNASVDANSTTAPDGTACTTCDIVGDAGASQQYINQTVGSNTNTISVFAKAGAYGYLAIRPVVGSAVWQNYNLTTGALAGGLNNTPANATIEDYGNGWYRCSYYVAGGTTTPAFYALDSDNVTNLQSTTGDGSAVSVYLWGMQAETGSTPSSYVPTTTAAATKAADVLGYTSPSTAPSVAAAFTLPNGVNAQRTAARLDHTSSSDLLFIGTDATSQVANVQYSEAGILQADVNGTTDVIDGARHTVAGSCETDNIALYVDGASEGTPDTSATVDQQFDNIDIGHNNTAAQLRGFLHYVKIYAQPGVSA